MLRLSAKAAALGVVAYTPLIAASALPIWGRGWVVPGVDIISAFVGGCAVAFTIAALPLLLARSYRSGAAAIVVFAGTLSVLFVITLWVANDVRMYGFHLAAKRAEPLIMAIEKHVANKGTPPTTLEQLVPTYIAAIPSGLPPLEIQSGPDTRKRYHGNDWVLSASVPWGFLNFDLFLYFPNQRYPESAYGGSLERIDKWAYVHE